jgi:hypothetical protein
MNRDGLYHQPRWVNAIVIAACVPIILGSYVMPTGISRLVTVAGTLLLFLFIGICNKLRSGAFFPRWVEVKNLSNRLESEKARKITEAELVILTAEVLAYDRQPRSLRALSEAVQHVASSLQITVRENWPPSSNSRSNEAIEFHHQTAVFHVEISNSRYRCSSDNTTQHSERCQWFEETTSTLAWRIAGHPFDSEAFRKVYFSMSSSCCWV